MSHRRTMSCLTVAMLVAAAFAVPTAMAKPVDPTGPANDPMTAPSAQQDSGGERSQPRPSYPRAILPITQIDRAPAQAAGDGGGSDAFPVALVLIGGALLACGGMAVAVMHLRIRHAH